MMECKFFKLENDDNYLYIVTHKIHCLNLHINPDSMGK